MRIVYFGTPELAVPALAALAERHDVTGVVTQPDKPQGRSKQLVPPPVKAWAVAHGIPVVQPEKLNDGTFEAWLREQKPDVCSLAAYGRFLKQPILDAAPHGIINLHPSLLPRWRGPSPIQSAILHGDNETGVSIMRLSLEMDAGDVLLQEPTPIGENETAGELSGRLAEMGARLLLEAIAQIENGAARFAAQDSAAATHCKLFKKEDGQIRWTDSAQKINNLIRAANPWPIAYTALNGETIRIYRATVIDAPSNATPGTITHVDRKSVRVAAGGGQLALQDIQAPGKKAMPIAAYLQGNTLKPGDQFE